MKLDKVLVIGNGESRKNLNLNNSKIYKIGCNAIARDTNVQDVICVDKKILQEVTAIQALSANIYTRTGLQSCVNFKTLPLPMLPYTGNLREDDPTHWGSGSYAVLLAAMKSKTVIMLGFDLYGIGSKINNCYKNTDCYNAADYRAVDPRYWIHQIGKVFCCFPETKFYIYQTAEWQLPSRWQLPNIFLDNIDNFPYN